MSGYQKVYERPNAEGMYLGCVFYDGGMWIAETRYCRLYYPMPSLIDGVIFLRRRHKQEAVG